MDNLEFIIYISFTIQTESYEGKWTSLRPFQNFLFNITYAWNHFHCSLSLSAK